MRALDRLNAILEDREWLVNDEFSAADVAVGAYLLYVPQVWLGWEFPSRLCLPVH